MLNASHKDSIIILVDFRLWLVVESGGLKPSAVATAFKQPININFAILTVFTEFCKYILP